MLIQVIRKDNEYDYVQDILLDGLIEGREIIKFKGAAGWVTVGKQTIRKENPENTAEDDNKIAAEDSTFAGQYRKAYSSSLESF